MKGVNKCFGLLLALFITLGLSLSVFSNDSNALQHDLASIPLDSQQIHKYFGSNGVYNRPFLMGWSSSFTSSQYLPTTRANFPVFGAYLDSNTGFCKASQYDQQLLNVTGFSSGSQQLSWQFPSTLYIGNPSSYNISTSRCRRSLYSFGSSYSYDFESLLGSPDYNVPTMDWDSINDTYHPITNRSIYNLRFKSYNPYYYAYSNFPVHDTYRSDSSGLVYNTTLKFSDLFTAKEDLSNIQHHRTVPNHFSHLQLPFGVYVDGRYPTSDIGHFTEGRNFTVKGVFNIKDAIHDGTVDSFNFSPAFRSNGFWKLRLEGFNGNWGTVYNQNVDCQVVTRGVLSDIQLEYTCSLDLAHDYDSFSLWLDVGFSSVPDDPSEHYIWNSSVDQEVTFSSIAITTDYDSTPGQSLYSECHGNECDGRPGSAAVAAERDEGDPDFFESIVGMFSFTFTNPFQPIFAMFQTNDSCAQIPIIASMIHSNTTEVCPWFSTDVRNLLTPVFGLSSAMLIFGFAVRWLGSSSGNFFEDTAGETLTYSNWYGEGRGFKRTPASSGSRRRFNK